MYVLSIPGHAPSKKSSWILNITGYLVQSCDVQRKERRWILPLGKATRCHYVTQSLQSWPMTVPSDYTVHIIPM